MKRWLSFLLCTVLAMTLAGCGGNIKNVTREPAESELYTAQDIEQAMDEALDYFHRNFKGCTMTRIYYVGDDRQDAFDEWAETCGCDEAIILESDFQVDSSGGDGSLKPDSTYTRWQWILARDKGGSWKHKDHGYG